MSSGLPCCWAAKCRLQLSLQLYSERDRAGGPRPHQKPRGNDKLCRDSHPRDLWRQVDDGLIITASYKPPVQEILRVFWQLDQQWFKPLFAWPTWIHARWPGLLYLYSVSLIYLSFRQQYHIVLNPRGLWKILKSGSVSSQASFFFWLF